MSFWTGRHLDVEVEGRDEKEEGEQDGTTRHTTLRGAVSPEGQRVARRVRPSTPESELSMMLLVVSHVRGIGERPRQFVVKVSSNPSRRLAAAHEPESQTDYRWKPAGRSDPHAKTLALIALARHRPRRLYKLLPSASSSQQNGPYRFQRRLTATAGPVWAS